MNDQQNQQMHIASFSEPPIGKPGRAPTIADVLMRLVHDGPMYAVIVLVGIMAIKGTADARDFVITGLGSLLARSFPRAVQVPAGAIVVLFFVTRAFGFHHLELVTLLDVRGPP